MDLEKEFQKLMDEAVQRVQDKQTKGEITVTEADDLIDMIAQRRQRTRAWNSSGCSYDDYDSSIDYDEGWNRSGQSC